MGTDLNRDLARLVEDAQTPLEDVVLLASHRSPDVDVAGFHARLDGLSAGLTLDASPDLKSQRLAAHLHDGHGFDGEPEDYYHPRHSDLAWVAHHGRGLPLSLSLIYAAVGRRAGQSVEIIGFPGHVLIRHGGPDGVLQDPFHGGRTLTDRDLANLAGRFLGHPSRLEAEHLLPLRRKALVVRVLANLRNAHARRNEHARCVMVCDSLFAITGAPEALRDRGLHALAAGIPSAAAADLRAYLSQRPDARDRDSVAAALKRCRVSTPN
ncbi:MAG: transglutaminase-like domain-containing protein [Myxococcota bacterium]